MCLNITTVAAAMAAAEGITARLAGDTPVFSLQERQAARLAMADAAG